MSRCKLRTPWPIHFKLRTCNKTKCITVRTKQKLAFQNEELSLTINSEQLQHSACEKLLGIKID
jgi:hypothetical protein